MADLLFETFMVSFLPLILFSPYLLLFFAYYAEVNVRSKREINDRDRRILKELKSFFWVFSSAAFFVYLIIILYTLAEQKLFTFIFLGDLGNYNFIFLEQDPSKFWFQFGIYLLYMIIIFICALRKILLKKGMN